MQTNFHQWCLCLTLTFPLSSIEKAVLSCVPQYHSHTPPIAHIIECSRVGNQSTDLSHSSARVAIIWFIWCNCKPDYRLNGDLTNVWLHHLELTSALHLVMFQFIPESQNPEEYTECLSVSPTHGIRPVPSADGPDNRRCEHLWNIVDWWVKGASDGARFERMSHFQKTSQLWTAAILPLLRHPSLRVPRWMQPPCFTGAMEASRQTNRKVKVARSDAGLLSLQPFNRPHHRQQPDVCYAPRALELGLQPCLI